MKRKIIGFVALLCLAWNAAAASAEGKTLIAWQPHNLAAFTQAAQEKKFLILDLEAVWCHWCHVMDAKTYADPKVAAYIKQHFIPMKADHDARPDLAERYRERSAIATGAGPPPSCSRRTAPRSSSAPAISTRKACCNC
jgi:thioredoxin-related protein